jgi:hypothetical protein
VARAGGVWLASREEAAEPARQLAKREYPVLVAKE